MGLHAARSARRLPVTVSMAVHLESCLSVGFYFSICKLNLYSTHGSSPQNEEEKWDNVC